MRNKFWLGVLLLVVMGLTTLQWVRVSNEKDRLNAGIRKLQHDLAEIAHVKARLPEFERSTVEANIRLNELHKLLPDDLNVEYFLGELSEELETAGFEITSVDVTPSPRDFYFETQVLIQLKEEVQDPEVIKELIRKFKRLVSWEGFSPGPPAILYLNIYSLMEPLKPPVIRSCPEENTSEGGWFPFSALLDEPRKTFRRLCDERQNEEAIRLEIKKFEKLRQYLEVGSSIITALSKHGNIVNAVKIDP